MNNKYDNVNNPKHYADGCSVECIDMMQTAIGWDGIIYFCLGNAYKYLWRHKLKNNPEEDLNKAKWYIDRAITMAQDDPDSYGYLLSMAEPLIRLIETYRILYQSKKPMNDYKEFEKAIKKHIEGKDIFSDRFLEGVNNKNSNNDCITEDNLVLKFQKDEEEENDWERIEEILAEAYDYIKFAYDPYNIFDAKHGLSRALSIARKHCGRDS